MADDRDKVIHKDEQTDEPDVEAHKVVHANDEKKDEETETPDVEAHKVQHKVQH